MGSGEDDEPPGTGGSDAESRQDRELIELLNELRVMTAGVQILFAFLLTVPYTNRFAEATQFQRTGYLVALAAAAVATVLLVTPSVQHRIEFRNRDKEHLLHRSNLYSVLGATALGIAMVSAVLVVDFVYGRTEAYVLAGAVGTAALALWLVGPATRRGRQQLDGSR